LPSPEDPNPLPTAEALAPARGRFQWLRPSHAHTAFSATLLLMASSLLSGVMGLVRSKYIAYIFGAGRLTDAYNAAFEMPDMISYFLVGGVASIALITMLSRYREAGDEEGADRALSIVLNAMLVVLGTAILLGEFLAPVYTRYKFPGFDVGQAALTTSLTRLLLPAPLFFFAGGVFASKLLVRKIFLYQAFTPLIYNLGIILGGVFLHRRFGIYSLAIGVLGGVAFGPFALNFFGARRLGFRYRPILNLRHPAFREWLHLSVPLMVGFSLVTADKWILSFFASHSTGGISHLNYAKTLFAAPLGMLGQAAGAASLPFFAALFSQNRPLDFAAAVNRSVTRIIAVSLLVGAWMMALALPLVDLLFRGGHFNLTDAADTAHYFVILAVSLALWAAQSIYARAFYAAGNTMTPAVAGTVITLVSIPIYRALFHGMGIAGLAAASDVGILAHTLTLAFLLHRNRLVRVSGLEGGELARSLLAACGGFAGAYACVRYIPIPHGHLGDLAAIAVATVAWAVPVWTLLRLTGSTLPQQLRSRRA
jgi:putative peptidoglycan lipid II flippase